MASGAGPCGISVACVGTSGREGREGREGGSPHLLFSFPPFPTAVKGRRKGETNKQKEKKRTKFYKGPEEGEKW
ncbi:hypothetical protein TCDM_07899 [Trypanosoma cruzi Dm28c]|uniref:Uncharacterized protein n=1 Tax=Trypanosoma cruzi Dm28c TaxID=1416333 RepID=V5BI40_TRYCR|nr:hypothetical protein TCDM_07899 [Trypanosoma cruzi Dm28c]